MPPDTSDLDAAASTDPLQLLEVAKKLLGEGRLDVLPEALSLVDRAIEMLSARSPEEPGIQRSLADALLTRANVLRETGTPDTRAAALPVYRQAIAQLEAALDQSRHADCNELANAWTQLGMCLLDEHGEAAWEEARTSFERAITLRDGLPLDSQPLYRWGLCAAWMNRADALTRLGGEERLQEALRSYDEAIKHLEQLPASEHPSYLTRHALSWMNRGLTHRALDTGDALAKSVECFDKAISLLTPDGKPSDREQQRILACSHMNRSNTYLAMVPERPREAREDALAALSLMTDFERTELLSAQMGLQSRHLLCRATAYLADAGAATPDWVTETTDAVDEGMALTRHWNLLGENRLEPLACELFHFGALIYRLCQPHFLTEFLLESMDPEQSPGAPAGLMEMHHIATDALWSAAEDVRNREEEGEISERMLALIEDLQEAEASLTSLRERHVTSPVTS